MPTIADLEERAIWKLEQAGHTVTPQPGHGSTAARSTIAPPALMRV